MDLKKVRKALGKSQVELAELFNCTQAFISQIENRRTEMPSEFISILNDTYGSDSINRIVNSKLLGIMGWKDASDPLYESIKSQLIDILQQIQQKTGLSNEEISAKIYRNKKTIPDALLNLNQVSPNMNAYIMKRLNTVGLSERDIKLNKTSSKGEILHFKNIQDFSKFIHGESVANANSDMNFSFIDCDYFVDSPYTINGIINKGDIMALKHKTLKDLIFNKLYVILFKNGGYNIQYISQGSLENNIGISASIPSNSYNYILKDSLSHVYNIESLITITEL